MVTLKDLSRKANKIRDDIDELVNRSVVNLTIEVLSELVNTTPIDEGTAISNWQISLTGPIRTVIPTYVLGSQGSTKNIVIANTIGQAVGILAARRPGQVIYLGNALPYIAELNRGSSNQAPAGFIDAAFMRARLAQDYLRLSYG